MKEKVWKIVKRYWVTVTFAVLSVVFFMAAAGTGHFAGNVSNVASSAQASLGRRLARLDKYAAQALQLDSAEWMDIKGVKEDMVLYKYDFDTLQAWQNLFPVSNDDVRSRLRYQRISRPEYNIISPLASIGEHWEFVNLGTKWYMARRVDDGDSKSVIAGLEICSVDGNGNYCSVNPHLHIPDHYSLSPITGNVGNEVSLDGKPIFLITETTSDVSLIPANSPLRWAGLLCFVIALISFYAKKRGPWTLAGTLLLLTGAYLLAFNWGLQMRTTSMIFSPSIYAGGTVWSSFGALAALNIYIFLCILCLFLYRRKWLRLALSGQGRRRKVLYGTVCIALFLALSAYIIISLRNLVLNSGISLTLQWFRSGIGYTICTLAIYTCLLGALLMLLQMAAPAIKLLTGLRINAFSYRSVSIAAVLFAATLFTLSTQLGFQKEESRARVWAYRLSAPRDLALELSLRSMEPSIAEDGMIARLASVNDGGNIITNRIKENYLYRSLGDYDINVEMCSNEDIECLMLFSKRLGDGTPIAPDSRFMCIYNNNGKASYAGMFTYVDPVTGGLIRLLLDIDSKSNREDNGYNSIFKELSGPGNSVKIPDNYSYAKYIDKKLVSYKGTYGYPTLLSEKYLTYLDRNRRFFRSPKSIHFINKTDENEVIIISRAKRSLLQALSAVLTILAFVFVFLLPLAYRHRRIVDTRRTFKKRITAAFIVAISAALVSVAAVSIKFVFDRNASDSYNMMTSKISTIQTLIETEARDAEDYAALVNQEFRNRLLDIASTTKSDLSLYSADGMVFISTVSDVFEQSLLSPRIYGNAYDGIVNKHQRVGIYRESIDGHKYYAMYAPIFNQDDRMVAIVSSPYTDHNNVMREAVPHAILMLILVLTLLVVFTTAARRVVDRLLDPLTEIGRKMSAVSTSGLEYIHYDHDDEITSLIDSYNRMVGDLEESTRILAETERDKAWSEMARQVAHEIKNPLTPMKLTIQRLIRMKERGDGTFDERFGELSGVILEQIDILTETANEFSTFAKLYSEEPVDIDLDQMLQEQISLFDNRENVKISYIGRRDSVVNGPKPQIIRVFVNLISNAIQAVDGRDGAAINVLLRTAQKDGFYEIVVEDNGSGVSEENIGRLFTPNFTTKSSGTGLGLAISRNIIKKCGGEISYRRSYTLGGAAFTVLLPVR